jgi:transposase-like protein
MNTSTEPVKLDPDATYTDKALASAFGVSDRQLRRWRDNRQMRFPKPFMRGRTPCWKGSVLLAWESRRQQEAMA